MHIGYAGLPGALIPSIDGTHRLLWKVVGKIFFDDNDNDREDLFRRQKIGKRSHTRATETE